MGTCRRRRGELEREVLAVLATARDALTIGQVQAQLGEAHAYTTVATVLNRLCAKGAVTRAAAGRGHTYRWTGASSGVTARRMRQLLDADTDRSDVLARFVDELSPGDEQLLAQLLRRPGGTQS